MHFTPSNTSSGNLVLKLRSNSSVSAPDSSMRAFPAKIASEGGVPRTCASAAKTPTVQIDGYTRHPTISIHHCVRCLRTRREKEVKERIPYQIESTRRRDGSVMARWRRSFLLSLVPYTSRSCISASNAFRFWNISVRLCSADPWVPFRTHSKRNDLNQQP